MPGGTYKNLSDEIERRWAELTNSALEPENNQLTLPNPFIAPSNGLFHGDQFYWDTYFTIIGLIPCGRIELAQGMVDNLLHLVDQFGFVPMRNRMFNTGISQPPFLTSMIRLIYDETHDSDWLARSIQRAEREYWSYWRNDTAGNGIANHLVHEGLSRYADHFLTHQTAEHESGWDMTSRFNNRCLDILPVDLNALLYKYETDFAWYYELHNVDKATEYRQLAATRKQTINKLMWHAQDGRYYDYDYVRGKQTRFSATSCYVPLWAELADDTQAKAMHESLEVLIKPGGLINTAVGSLPQKQWDHPNGWAPMQWLIIEGLKNYGFNDQAQDITERWLTMVAGVYESTNQLWEKYDVIRKTPGKEGRYPNQTGFGWTNGVCAALILS